MTERLRLVPLDESAVPQYPDQICKPEPVEPSGNIPAAVSTLAWEGLGAASVSEGHLVRGGILMVTGLVLGGLHVVKRRHSHN